MNAAAALALLGVAVILAGVLSERLHPSLGPHRTLLIAFGAVILVVAGYYEVMNRLFEGLSAVSSNP